MNQDVNELESSPQHASNFPIWKVLIFDKAGSETISSVLRISDLRKHGVTVHMNITSFRQPIADVPAIYFVQPTQENIELIIEVWISQYHNFQSINLIVGYQILFCITVQQANIF